MVLILCDFYLSFFICKVLAEEKYADSLPALNLQDSFQENFRIQILSFQVHFLWSSQLTSSGLDGSFIKSFLIFLNWFLDLGLQADSFYENKGFFRFR